MGCEQLPAAAPYKTATQSQTATQQRSTLPPCMHAHAGMPTVFACEACERRGGVLQAHWMSAGQGTVTQGSGGGWPGAGYSFRCLRYACGRRCASGAQRAAEAARSERPHAPPQWRKAPSAPSGSAGREMWPAGALAQAGHSRAASTQGARVGGWRVAGALARLLRRAGSAHGRQIRHPREYAKYMRAGGRGGRTISSVRSALLYTRPQGAGARSKPRSMALRQPSRLAPKRRACAPRHSHPSHSRSKPLICTRIELRQPLRTPRLPAGGPALRTCT